MTTSVLPGGLSPEVIQPVRDLLIRLVHSKHLLGFHYASW